MVRTVLVRKKNKIQKTVSKWIYLHYYIGSIKHCVCKCCVFWKNHMVERQFSTMHFNNIVQALNVLYMRQVEEGRL